MRLKIYSLFALLLLAGIARCQISPVLSSPSDKTEFVPAWAKSAIWYQIFPERFRNGDATNDPKVEDQEGAWPHDITSEWNISPWTSDWYEFQPWEQKNGKDIWYNIQRRRYGGDLKGILDKLDYIKDLGVNSIYLTPIFISPSLHKYDGASYHHVDPSFGPDPIGDKKIIASEVFDDPSTWKWTSADKLALQLIKEVHKKGMHIIFDGVFNHMGINNPAFQDIKKNQENSKYKNWFDIQSFENKEKGTQFKFNGWFGVPELPELKEDSMGIVKEPRAYIFACTKRWLNPEVDGKKAEGIDGWRLDVAFCVNHNFWKAWRKVVKTANPNAYIVAEVVDSINVVKTYLKGDEFDAIMNYNFAFNSTEYFVNKTKQISTSGFDKKMHTLVDAYPGGASYVMQNLFDSHDSHRLSSFIVNRNIGKMEDWGKGFFDATKGNNKAYSTLKPTDADYKVQKLMAIYQMTFVGAPMVYYGDEVGMWGANDPCERKPMVWNDLKYSNEAFLADGTKRTTGDKVEVNQSLRDHYKKMTSIRNSNTALQLGSFETLLTDDQNKVWAFSRKYEKQEVIVVLNNSEIDKNTQVKIAMDGSFKDVLNNNESLSSKNGILNLKLKSLWGCVLVRNK